MDNDAPAEIVAISSQVVRGAVGNRAVVFSLEAMGHPVLSLPTVILPWHPGHGPSTRVALPTTVSPRSSTTLPVPKAPAAFAL